MTLLTFEEYSAQNAENAAVRLWLIAPEIFDQFPYSASIVNTLTNAMVSTTPLLQPLIDAMITNYITQSITIVTSDVEQVWTDIKEIAGVDSATTDMNLFINTLITLVNDSRVSFATRNDISNTVNDLLDADNLESFNDSFNGAQVMDLDEALAAVTQMNNLWNNFGNELNTAVPGILTNDAVAKLQAAAPLIQEVINQLSPSA